MLDYQRLVRAAEALDPVPTSVTRLLDLVGRDRWSFSDIEQVIALDQALTGRVLQVANSWASASYVPIVTVKDAVIRVGVAPVVSYAMAACMKPTFRRALPEYGLSEGQLWRHSVAAALAAEVVSAMCPDGVPVEAVTAALLHDVGKLVIARFLTPDLLAGMADARTHGERSAMQAEVDVLGVHHGELGGLIVRHWGLPERLADAVTNHHAPDRLGNPVCDAVHLANIAARLVAGPPPQSASDVRPAAGPIERLRLDADFLDRLVRHVERRFDETLATYDAVSEPRLKKTA